MMSISMASSTSLLSCSALGFGSTSARGFFVDKSSFFRQLSSSVSTFQNSNCDGTKEARRRRRRRRSRCSVSLKRAPCRCSRHGALRTSLLPLRPSFTLVGHGELALPVVHSAFVCRNSSGNPAAVVEEQIKEAGALVEVGYIADAHGLQGELRVHSLTDFPEERFQKPGMRWLRTRSMGRPSLQQVELLKGRIRPGKRPSWLITLKGINTPEKASELVGSTMLVTEDERPPLDEDEFYIPHLVGMTVAIQESGEEIGVVLNVFSPGGDNDLLQVGLVPPVGKTSGRKVWIPFVKEIVPVVDNVLRRIEITPPEGLLELNAPAEDKSTKDIQNQELKQNRKLRGQFAGLKKKITAMKQTHILAGLTSGKKPDQEALRDQLLSMDFGLLQQALKEAILLSKSLATESAHTPEPPSAFPSVNWRKFDSWMDTPTPSGEDEDSKEDDADMARWWEEGLQLIADGRVAVVVLAGGQSTRLEDTGPPVKGMVDLGLPSGKSLFQLQADRLLLVQELASQVVDPEFNPFIPWIVLTSDATDASTHEYFEETNYFGLDESQVWFIKQDSMPCFSLQSSEGDQNDILMETPWKVSEAPNGNGGLFSALHSEGIIDRLVEEGIDYVQVYAVDNALVRVADPVFFGYTKEREADVGVKVVTKVSPEEAIGVVCLEREGGVGSVELKESSSMDMETSSSHYRVLEYSETPKEVRYAYEQMEECKPDTLSDDCVASPFRDWKLKFRAGHICVNIFSVDFLRRLGESDFELKFHSVLKQIPHVKKEGKTWVEMVPTEPNGMKLELFIFDVLKFCDPEKVALLEVCREEEFAPVKNAAGPGVPDSVATARELVLALQRRLQASTFSELENPHRQLLWKLLVSYLGGNVDENVLELLNISNND